MEMKYVHNSILDEEYGGGNDRKTSLSKISNSA